MLSDDSRFWVSEVAAVDLLNFVELEIRTILIEETLPSDSCLIGALGFSLSLYTALIKEVFFFGDTSSTLRRFAFVPVTKVVFLLLTE